MNRRFLAASVLALLGTAFAQRANAADVYWSVGVDAPGVYTRVGNHVPPQRVIVAPPPVYAPAPVYYMPPPPRAFYGPAPVIVVPGGGWHDHDRPRHWRERHGHGQFDAHGGRWDRHDRGDWGDRRGDPWRR